MYQIYIQFCKENATKNELNLMSSNIFLRKKKYILNMSLKVFHKTVSIQ